MKRFFWILVSIFLCVNLTACTQQYEEIKPLSSTDGTTSLEVMFINVGKADSMLISVDEKHYLIDTGEKSSVVQLFSALNLLKIKELDGVFLTHTHSDHIGGMKSLAKNYPVKMMYSAEITQRTKKGENKFVKISNELSVPHTELNAGDIIAVNNTVRFKVLAPIELNRNDDNDNSLVLQLEANGFSFLFTGDMSLMKKTHC